MKRYLILIAIVFAFVGIITVRSMESPTSPQNNTLRVGLQSGYPPFEFVNNEGRIVGFDVDLAHAIADKMNKALVIVDMEFQDEIISLQEGRIDLIISGMNITPERIKEMLMVPYYGNTQNSLSLLFWNTIPEGIHSLSDIEKLPNKTVSVSIGTISEAYILRHLNIPIHTFQGSLAPLMDVKNGHSIANLVETDTGEILAKQHPEVKILSIPIPDELAILGFGIGVKKENVNLFDQVYKIITELKTSGELKALQVKWFQGKE